MHLFLICIPIHVPGVHYCQKYASASHQVPANQKSIQLLLFRKYTHCCQHSTKGRLNYGPQSFETCLYNHFDTHEAQHHDTIFNHRIDILPHQYVLQIPTLCLCRVCARARVCVCVDTSVWIRLCIYTHK